MHFTFKITETVFYTEAVLTRLASLGTKAALNPVANSAPHHTALALG